MGTEQCFIVIQDLSDHLLEGRLYSLQSYYPTSQLIFCSYLLVYLLFKEFGPSCVYHTFGHEISYDLNTSYMSISDSFRQVLWCLFWQDKNPFCIGYW